MRRCSYIDVKIIPMKEVLEISFMGLSFTFLLLFDFSFLAVITTKNDFKYIKYNNSMCIVNFKKLIIVYEMS